MSLYQLKPAFQTLLRPLVRWLFAAGVTANQVTLGAAAISVALGLGLWAWAQPGPLFLLIPLWMLLRMALNAVDGMLAREFGQKSALGAYLNELTDVIADAALYLPFVLVPGVSPVALLSLIFWSVLVEYAGVLGLMVGASRRYDGPLGKSDRALVFGLLGLLVGLGVQGGLWLNLLLWTLVLLSVCTLIKRVRQGLFEAASTR